jgi:uncharacterized surface anchored protein
MRRLSVVPAVLLTAMALVAPSAAFATEPTSGYNQEPPKPSTGTSPSKETSTPTTPKETAPATSGTEPAKSTTAPSKESAKASTLPFTGFDLRWSIAIGVLLMGAGLSIVAVQRRGRRAGAR